MKNRYAAPMVITGGDVTRETARGFTKSFYESFPLNRCPCYDGNIGFYL
jgi:hypothetical protein